MRESTKWILAVLVVFIAVCAITFIFPHHENAGQDTIAILAILVTVLIGWNIYNIIDIRTLMAKNEKIEKIFELQKHENTLQQLQSEVMRRFVYAASLFALKKYISAAEYYASCLKGYALIERYGGTVNDKYIKACLCNWITSLQKFYGFGDDENTRHSISFHSVELISFVEYIQSEIAIFSDNSYNKIIIRIITWLSNRLSQDEVTINDQTELDNIKSDIIEMLGEMSIYEELHYGNFITELTHANPR